MAKKASSKPLDEDELEERLAHSYTGGEHAALEGIVREMKVRAGELFSEGHDETAAEVRRLASEFGRRLAESSERLEGYIKRSMGR